MKLYFNPVSSYSQKTLTAFYEKNIDFDPVIVNLMDPAAREAYRGVNPLGKVPTLVLEDGVTIPESTTIIEYLEDHFLGKQLIPTNKDLARETRFHDRNFDLYVNDPVAEIFFDGRKPPEARNAAGVAAAKVRLDILYKRYDEHFAKRTWAIGNEFTMADCAAAPAFNYGRMVYPFTQYPNLTAYVGRLVERPSFARVLKDAMPMLAAMQAR